MKLLVIKIEAELLEDNPSSKENLPGDQPKDGFLRRALRLYQEDSDPNLTWEERNGAEELLAHWGLA